MIVEAVLDAANTCNVNKGWILWPCKNGSYCWDYSYTWYIKINTVIIHIISEQQCLQYISVASYSPISVHCYRSHGAILVKVKVLGYNLQPVILLCQLHKLPQIIGPIHSWFRLNYLGSIQPGYSLSHRTDQVSVIIWCHFSTRGSCYCVMAITFLSPAYVQYLRP